MNDDSRRAAERPRGGDDEATRMHELDTLAAKRFRIGLVLTAGMLLVYFGFILLVALNKPLLGNMLTGGLSLGILLGVLVILATWALTWYYVAWANRVYEPEIRRLRR